ncbi:MAG TPA: TPM domain-containing protein [Longimicrobium sp.]|nr:TPM domain-containing protein [Longimicrobium sp.]
MNARVPGMVAALVLAATSAAAQNGYPEWNGHPVQDLAEVLSPGLEDSVRTLLAPARNQGVDVRVVTIRSMSAYPVSATTIEGFGQGLFNAWRVGDRPENDGVLLLVATEDRRVRIQLGDGALLYEQAARQVVSDSIVRWFREQQMARGILRGTAGIAEWFTPAGQAAFAAAPPPAPLISPPAPAPPTESYYIPPPRSGFDRWWYYGGGSRLVSWGAIAILVSGVLGLGFRMRNRPRKCAQCGTQMSRLDEEADDVYLDSGQKTEEFLRSVDYDVWKCGACGHHALLRYSTWFSGKSTCPACRYHTVETRRHVLQYATYDHGGSEEVLRDCRHCGYHDRDVVHLPQKIRPQEDTSSSAWSSSSSSSYSSSSSSSSSSSGGGHSSGGGASGSW